MIEGMISVLVPTRGRPDSLRRSVASLVEGATSPHRLEIAIAVDPDDPYADASWRAISGFGAHSLRLVVPERYGYSQLHRYFNALAKRTLGEWLLLWNDDAIMTTPGWDAAIRALDPRTVVADCWAPPHSPWLITFPAVRRWAVDVVGAFSPHTCHCDTYWEMIGRGVPRGTVQVPGATVRHERHDLTGAHHDATWLEGAGGNGYRREHFYSAEVQRLIQADIEKVRRAHLERFGEAA